MIKLIWKDVEWRTKTAKTVPTAFEQKFTFESFGLHFWENNCLTSNNIDQIDLKRCWMKTTKTANTVPTAFDQKFAFKSFGLYFWEKIDWEQTIIIKLIGKDVGRRTKNSKCCAHCLRAKVCFWNLRASFLRKWLFDIKH